NEPYQYKEIAIPATPGTADASPTHEERVKETYATILEEIRKKIDAEAEAVHIILTGIDNDIYSTVDACPNAKDISYFNLNQNGKDHKVVSDEEEIPIDKEIQKLMALISTSFKKIYKPTNNNLKTSSSTRNKNVDNTPSETEELDMTNRLGSIRIKVLKMLLGIGKM
ncbi:hypothetical protein Tco_1129695, partial [Tanacetum coccineum]